jgi:hypothetical protein
MRISSLFFALALSACAAAPPPQVALVQPQAVEPPPEVEPPPPPVAPRGPRLSDGQITRRIISASRSAYYSTGHPCACPDDTTRAGHSCGNTSAYTKLGGIKCFPQDVTRADIAAYRNQTGM